MPETHTLETRALAPQPARVRVERRDDDKPIITGYAAVFYRAGDPSTEYPIWSDLVERIMPGAFDNALKEGDDVRCLFNHDKNQVLGLRSSGTAKFSVDKVGLKFEVTPPDTQAGRDVVTLIDRGDVPGASFTFLTSNTAKRGKVVWVTETVDGNTIDIREIHDLELFEAGPVIFPCYEGTSVDLRCCSREGAQLTTRERDDWRKREKAEQLGIPTADEVEMRARLAELRLDELEI